MVFKKGYTPWNKGKRLSEEHKKHMKESRINNPNYFGHTGTRPNISKALLKHYKTHASKRIGQKHTQETKDKISAANSGRKLGPFSEERREQISERQIGKQLSEPTKEKIAKAHTGMKMSAEHRRNISLGLLGHKVTKETRKGMSESQKGRVITEEHRKKISLAHIIEETNSNPRNLNQQAAIEAAEVLANLRNVRLGRKNILAHVVALMNGKRNYLSYAKRTGSCTQERRKRRR